MFTPILRFIAEHCGLLMVCGVVFSFAVTTPWLIYRLKMIDKIVDEMDEGSLGAGDGCE